MPRRAYGPLYFKGKAKTPSEILNETTAEKTFQQSVIETFEWRGWRAFHSYDSRRDTEYGETGRGYPDIVCARAGRLVVAELKTEIGTVSPEQLLWLGLFMLMPGVEVYTWRPHDIDVIHKIAE